MSCKEKLLLLERYHEDRLNVRELRGRGGGSLFTPGSHSLVVKIGDGSFWPM